MPTSTIATLPGSGADREARQGDDRRIKNGVLRFGMTKEQVLMSRGYPPAHETPSLDFDAGNTGRTGSSPRPLFSKMVSSPAAAVFSKMK